MDSDLKKWQKIKEGTTEFIIFKDADRIYDASVFYNPRMKINRDFTLLLLATLENFHSKPLSFLDPFAGTGVRCYRILNELPNDLFSRICASDTNPIAFEILKKNKERDFSSDKFKISLSDANDQISNFDYHKRNIYIIDIDPFGSPIEFIYSSLKALGITEGYLLITATDLRVLCGKSSEACLRIYNSLPTRDFLCHEVALRILFYNLLISAGRLGLYLDPILSFHHEHFLRVKVRVFRNKEKANEQHKKLGFVYFCIKCSYVYTKTIFELNHMSSCPICSNNINKAGPLWLGPLNSEKFVSSLLDKLSSMKLPSEKEIERLLLKIQEEINVIPFFYFMPNLLRNEQKQGVRIKRVIELLRENNFKASRSVFNPEGIKTNASFEEIRGIIKQL